MTAETAIGLAVDLEPRESVETDFAASLSAPRLGDLPHHVLPADHVDDIIRASRDPNFNAFPLMARESKVERAIAALNQRLSEERTSSEGPLLNALHYDLGYLPELLDRAVAGEEWIADVRDAWRIVREELVRNTEQLCRRSGDTVPFVMLAIGASTGKHPHCDSGGLAYCDFLGGVPTQGYGDDDAKLEILMARQGAVVVPRLKPDAQPIRFEGAQALFLRGYGRPLSREQVTYANGKPFVHNAPNPNDPVQPFRESSRLIYVAVS